MPLITPRTAETVSSRAMTPDARARLIARRSVIAGSGAMLLACAACGSNSTATAGPAASPTTSSGSAAAGAGSATGAVASTTTVIASVSDIPASSGLIATSPSGQLILAKAGGKVVAHTAVCTHQGAIIDGAGTCPLHGSMFNPATGAVVTGPASDPLAAVAVRVSGGKVYLA